MNPNKIIKKFGFFLFAFCLVLPLLAEETTIKSLAEGQTAPSFALRNLNGDWVRLNEICGEKLMYPWKNKTKFNVVLSFWATYCKPCKKELPQLEKVMEKYNANTKIFLISIDKGGQDSVRGYIQEIGCKSPVLLDAYQKTAERYGVKSVPSLFLLDTNGVVKFCMVGYKDDSMITRIEKEMQKLTGN